MGFLKKKNCCGSRRNSINNSMTTYIDVNVNVHVHSPDIPMSSADCTIYNPGIGTYSFIVSSPLGRMHCISAVRANHYNFNFFRSTRYPSLLGRQKQHGMRSMPDMSTHDQQWVSNPRSFDLESNALSTMPHQF